MRSLSLAKVRSIFPVLALTLAGAPAIAQVNLGRWGSAAPAGPAARVGPVSTSEINASNNLGPGADLHLEFPIFNRALPNRAQVQATLVYDSLFWQQVAGNWQAQAGAGWWLRTNAGKVAASKQIFYAACGWTTDGVTDDGTGNIYNYSFTMDEPDGSSAPAGTVMEASPPHGRHVFDAYWDCPTGDTLPETFYVGDGKGYEVIANGTYSSVSGAGYNGFGDNVTDGLVDLNGNSMSASGTTLSDALGPVVGISGSNPVDYTYTGPNSTPETIAVGYTSIYATANFGCYNAWSGYLSVPSYIRYPDDSTYTFGYDSAGRLASVSYPGGGEVSYSHSMVVQCSPSTVIESFTQTDSLDGNNSWSWQYNDSSGGNETTQTDPYGNMVVTDFDSAGNTTEQDAYDLAHQVTTVLVSDIGNSRTWATHLHAATDLVAAHTQTTDGYGFTTATSDTDWGSGSPGAVLRQTANGYTTVANGEVRTSSTVEDGAGNELAKTTWTVDSHGNPLSESDYVTNNSATALTTSFGVNGNGTIHTVTEPNAAVTTFGYACGSGFFPSSVQTVVGTTTAAWDCNGGAETSATGLNGHATSAAYDAMWRPTHGHPRRCERGQPELPGLGQQLSAKRALGQRRGHELRRRRDHPGPAGPAHPWPNAPSLGRLQLRHRADLL